MQAVVRWCLDNRAVVVLFTLILMGAGVASLSRLNQELLPSVDFPSVFVLVTEPGAGPEQVDRDVTLPLVDALTGLPRARHVISQSSQGFSSVQVDFALDSSVKEDEDVVNQRLAQIQLPSGAGKPLVQTFSFTALPTMTYALSARDGDLARATAEADDTIVPALAGTPGVAQVKVVGGARPAVFVTVEAVRLAQKGVSLQQVEQALASASVDLPAGTAVSTDKTLPVEVKSSVGSVEELRNLVVAPAVPFPESTGPASASAPSRGPGVPRPPVTLAEVATVVMGSQTLNGISRTDGVPSLQIQVIRAEGGNAVQVSDEVRRRIAGLRLSAQDALQLTYDAARDIRASINDLLLEGLIGAALAVLVIFLFLGSLRATLVTAVSLPTSVLVALLGTAVGGFSLNALTLAGLTIAVGRIVDDAIVVLENSYRHLQQGEPPREAALRGATEVSSAVISSTLTTVGVFLPIGLVGGIISRFFLPFSITVTISLLASLLVALTLVPVLVSLFLKVPSGGAKANLQGQPGGRIGSVYRPLLAWALRRPRHKLIVLVVAGLALAGAVASLSQVPKDFFALGGSDQLRGSVALPPGTSVEQTSQRLREFERVALSDPAVKLVQVTVASSDYGGYTAAFSENTARLVILTKSRHDSDAVARRLQVRLDELYGKGNSQLSVVSVGPPSSAYTASVSGRDPQALRQASDLIVHELQGDPELSNVKSDLAVLQPEVLVTVDPGRAAQHSLTPQAVALVVATALSPKDLGALGGSGPRVIMRLDPAGVAAGSLPELPLGPQTRLGDVAAVSDTTAPTTITRVDGTRQVTVSADVLAADTQGASARATQRLSRLSLPAGVKLETGGTQTDINDSFHQMFVAIGVAVGIVFLILVTFFRSVVTPFVILTTMPLALIGGFLALFFSRQPLGLPALLGVLMVFGIVVSNAILLIDFVERNRAAHDLHEALLRAGTVRVRPILMTAVATVVALVPVAVGLSSGGGGGLISQSLAIVVEGGLISSTALTLLVIPVVYSLLKRRLPGRLARLEDGRAA